MARLRTVICLSILLFLVLGLAQASPTDKGSKNNDKTPATNNDTSADPDEEEIIEESKSPVDDEESEMAEDYAPPDQEVEDSEKSKDQVGQEEENPSDATEISPDADEINEDSETEDNEKIKPLTPKPNKNNLPLWCATQLQEVTIEVPGCEPSFIHTFSCAGHCRSKTIPKIFNSKIRDRFLSGVSVDPFKRTCECCTPNKVRPKLTMAKLNCSGEIRSEFVPISAAVSCSCISCPAL